MRQAIIAGIAGLLMKTAAMAQPSIDIDLSDRTLTYHASIADSTRPERAYTFDIAPGKKGHSTPRGEYEVRSIIHHPAWCPDPETAWLSKEVRDYVEQNTCIPYGHELNPMVAYFVRFDKHLGMHGTKNPFALKRQGSHGCRRMRPDDIIYLVEGLGLKKGTKVHIHQ